MSWIKGKDNNTIKKPLKNNHTTLPRVMQTYTNTNQFHYTSNRSALDTGSHMAVVGRRVIKQNALQICHPLVGVWEIPFMLTAQRYTCVRVEADPEPATFLKGDLWFTNARNDDSVSRALHHVEKGHTGRLKVTLKVHRRCGLTQISFCRPV